MAEHCELLSTPHGAICCSEAVQCPKVYLESLPVPELGDLDAHDQRESSGNLLTARLPNQGMQHYEVCKHYRIS